MATDLTGATMEFPPKGPAVFRALRMGRHLCRDDGEEFYDLQRRESEYRALFAALGYTLVYHEQGFYYFVGDSTLRSQRLRQATLFMLILFQDLEDNKFNEPDRSWERTLLERPFMTRELPHFATAQRRTLMDAVGISADSVDKVLRFLLQLGVIEPPEESAFRFKPPVYRFVDMFLQFADDDHWNRLVEHTESDDDDDSHNKPSQNGDLVPDTGVGDD